MTHVLCYILYDTCFMLYIYHTIISYVIYYMTHVLCYILYDTCFMLYIYDSCLLVFRSTHSAEKQINNNVIIIKVKGTMIVSNSIDVC